MALPSTETAGGVHSAFALALASQDAEQSASTSQLGGSSFAVHFGATKSTEQPPRHSPSQETIGGVALHDPRQLPLQVPSHCEPFCVPEQVPSHSPLQVPSQETATDAEPSQLPVQVASHLPLISPPVHRASSVPGSHDAST
jgi:hypothetical protein